MRALIQRVSRAQVIVSGESVGAIDGGLLVYAAAKPDDGPADVEYIAEKIAHLRIFQDSQGKMNLDVAQTGGAILLVSAFTLCADARKGRRPSFDSAASGSIAAPLVESLVQALRAFGLQVETGQFGADMLVESTNSGPITILLDSTKQM